MRLPDNFDDRGLLPPGEYTASFDQIRDSLLVRGPSQPVPYWDSDWRRFLTHQAEKLVGQLWAVGVTEIYLNGSFVEDKPHPNDIDGYFVCDVREVASGELHRRLNELDPYKIWTWAPSSRRPYRGFAKKQLPMWHVYRVELYPHYGQFSGIKDESGNELLFPAAFRRQRSTNAPKGVIRIVS